MDNKLKSDEELNKNYNLQELKPITGNNEKNTDESCTKKFYEDNEWQQEYYLIYNSYILEGTN